MPRSFPQFIAIGSLLLPVHLATHSAMGVPVAQFIDADKTIARCQKKFTEDYEAAGKPTIRILTQPDAMAQAVAADMATFLSKLGADVTTGAIAAQDATRLDRADSLAGRPQEAIRQLETLASIKEPFVIILDFQSNRMLGIDRWHRIEAFSATIRPLAPDARLDDVRTNAAYFLADAIKSWKPLADRRRAMLITLDVPSTAVADRIRLWFDQSVPADWKVTELDSTDDAINGQSKSARMSFEIRFPETTPGARLRRQLNAEFENGEIARSLSFTSTSDYLSIAKLVPKRDIPGFIRLTDPDSARTFNDRRKAAIQGPGARPELLILRSPSVADATFVSALGDHLDNAGFSLVSGSTVTEGLPTSSPEAVAGDAARQYFGRASYLLWIDREATTATGDPGAKLEPAYTARLIDPETGLLLASETWPTLKPEDYGEWDPRNDDIGGPRFIAGRLLDKFDQKVVINREPRALTLTLTKCDYATAQRHFDAVRSKCPELTLGDLSGGESMLTMRVEFPRTRRVGDIARMISEVVPEWTVKEQTAGRLTLEAKTVAAAAAAGG